LETKREIWKQKERFGNEKRDSETNREIWKQKESFGNKKRDLETKTEIGSHLKTVQWE
jgi:hypothetical protein